MGYNKTIWQTGDVVTATKLNNMENGIASNAPFIIGFSDEEYTTLDKTMQEIIDKFSVGYRCLINHGRDDFFYFDQVLEIEIDPEHGYLLHVFSIDDFSGEITIIFYDCSLPEDYPVLSQG